MNNVEQLPVKGTSDRPAPKRIMRPCESPPSGPCEKAHRDDLKALSAASPATATRKGGES